jgi:hypothetical protein
VDTHLPLPASNAGADVSFAEPIVGLDPVDDSCADVVS